MSVKQISIFMENKSGRIAEISRILANAGIDIRALSIADTTDFGIFRVIVNDPEKAEEICRKAGLMVAITKVIALRLEDSPGSFASAMQVLADNNISVEYMYALLTPCDGKYACVIINTSNTERALELFSENGISVLDENDVYNL